MPSFKEWIAHRKDAMGYKTQADLAKAAGLSLKTVQEIESSGSLVNRSWDTILSFANALHAPLEEVVAAHNEKLPANYLDHPKPITAEEELRKLNRRVNEILRTHSNLRPQELPKRPVPHYTSVSAVRKDLRSDEAAGTTDLPGGMKGDFTVSISGQCMDPRYLDGDRIACSFERWKSEGFVQGRDYWIRFDDDETTFKRVFVDDEEDDMLVLTPLNPEHQPWKIHRRHVVMAARVVGIIPV